MVTLVATRFARKTRLARFPRFVQLARCSNRISASHRGSFHGLALQFWHATLQEKRQKWLKNLKTWSTFSNIQWLPKCMSVSPSGSSFLSASTSAWHFGYWCWGVAEVLMHQHRHWYHCMSRVISPTVCIRLPCLKEGQSSRRKASMTQCILRDCSGGRGSK